MHDNIFINYRRQTDSGMAGRIYDKLGRDLPGVSIFMDVDKLNPGDDFELGLERSLSSCKVLLAVMGPNWANMIEQSGQRRLDNPDDFVRRELRTALNKNVRVIPVLVGGARMPDASELPADMKALASRQALEIRHERFNADVEALAKAIAEVTPGARGITRSVVLWGTGALALAAAVGGVAYLNTGLASEWLDQDGYQREFERQLARRYYPAKVEARAVGKTVTYRGEFVPFPPSPTFAFHSRHSIPDTEFSAFDARMTREGYQRQHSMEILVDNRRYHQGTWVKP